MQACVNPIGAQDSGCRFDKKPQFRYSGCHRYDVSAFNIVLGELFSFQVSSDWWSLAACSPLIGPGGGLHRGPGLLQAGGPGREAGQQHQLQPRPGHRDVSPQPGHVILLCITVIIIIITIITINHHHHYHYHNNCIIQSVLVLTYATLHKRPQPKTSGGKYRKDPNLIR